MVWLGWTGQTEDDGVAWWCGVVWCGGVYTTDWTEQRMGWEWGPGNHWGDLAQLQLETINVIFYLQINNLLLDFRHFIITNNIHFICYNTVYLPTSPLYWKNDFK